MNLLFLIAAAGFFGCESQQNSLTETILYTTLRPNNLDLYLFERDNLAPKRITNYKGLDYNAAFSPDGKWIVFVSSRAFTKDEWISGFHPQPDDEIFAKRIGSDDPAVQLTDDKWEDGITPSWTFIGK